MLATYLWTFSFNLLSFNFNDKQSEPHVSNLKGEQIALLPMEL